MVTLVITYLLAFLFLIGVLITVHEFGHAWVAHRLGVKVLRFSIGFGQSLWLRHYGKDKTEFVIAAIPIGGYVKMLDEREGEVASEELHRAFNRQSLKVRTAIVIAGPLFNFLFAILAYTMMYMIGITGMKALIGEVTPQSLADQAGFRAGSQIVAVNGEPTARWDSVIQATVENLVRDQKQLTFSVLPPLNSPPKQAEEVKYYQNLSLNLQGITIDDVADKGFLDKLGMYPLCPPPPAVISEILPGSPAQRAGLLPGDKIIFLDNQEINNWNTLADYISKRPDQEIKVKVARGQQQQNFTVKPDKQVDGQGRMGISGGTRKCVATEDQLITEQYSLWKALGQGLTQTWEMSILTLRIMGKMLTLQVSPKNISGPISIAEYAGKSAQGGIVTFLTFLGLVSVSLAVLNLLPIPLLDGGHLLFYLIEWVNGKPLTERTEYWLQQIGAVLLFSLMGLPVFNDLGRLFSG
jgi:regulator of sigma E protease